MFRKETRATLLVFALLIAGVALFPAPVPAGHGPTLTITTDTILASDFIGHIVIGADGITLDCAGHTISGAFVGASIGILVSGRQGVTVKNCVVENFTQGIRADISSGNTFTGNTVRGNLNAGFTMGQGSHDNTLTGNVAINNRRGFEIVFVTFGHTVIGNTAVGNLVGFLVDQSDNNLLTQNTAMNNGFGFVLGGSVGTVITGNFIVQNDVGLEVCKSALPPDNTILPNSFKGPQQAVSVEPGC